MTTGLAAENKNHFVFPVRQRKGPEKVSIVKNEILLCLVSTRSLLSVRLFSGFVLDASSTPNTSRVLVRTKTPSSAV